MKGLYRSLGWVCLWLCLTQSSLTAAASYVVVSTIGSQLTIVTAQEQTGTNRDRTYAEARPVSDPILDATALTAAKAAIQKARPGSSVATLRLSDAKLLADQEKWFGQAKLDAPELVELLNAEIGDDPATRLMIIAAHRADILLRLEHGYVGFGKAAGLGFYIDSVARVSRSDTGQKGQGVFGPFANFRIVLVDPRSLVIESEQAIAAGTARSATRAEDRDPWNVLSGQEKIRLLQELLTAEIARAGPKLFDQQSR